MLAPCGQIALENGAFDQAIITDQFYTHSLLGMNDKLSPGRFATAEKSKNKQEACDNKFVRACCCDKPDLNSQDFDVVSKQHCMLIVQSVKNAIFVQTEPGWVGGSVNFFSGIYGTVNVATRHALRDAAATCLNP